MIDLVYSSVDAVGFSQQNLIDLLKTSRRNNEKAGVTGMLLYHNGNFLQILEGEERSVRRLYKTIMTDPRHRDVMLIGTRKIRERMFDEWEMAFTNLDELDPTMIEGLSDYLDKPFSSPIYTGDQEFAYRFLHDFKRGITLR
jgi:hypothetical protein